MSRPSAFDECGKLDQSREWTRCRIVMVPLALIHLFVSADRGRRIRVPGLPEDAQLVEEFLAMGSPRMYEALPSVSFKYYHPSFDTVPEGCACPRIVLTREMVVDL